MAGIIRLNPRRQAFTLVEMLVAMALILFIMVILSEAFVAGLDSFRQLKAIGDMEEKLRSATMQLRHDLSADHFEGKRRLSDRNFWNLGLPREGFVHIHQWSPSINEGVDGDGNPSKRATGHLLQMTVKLRGNRPEDFFAANLTANPLGLPVSVFFQDQYQAEARYQSGKKYNSPWAEVAYYLIGNGKTAGTTPLFALYRSQLVVLPDTRKVNANPTPYESEICCIRNGNGSGTFYNPTDLAGVDGPTPVQPKRALLQYPPPTNAPTVPLGGATLLLTDVISFDIQLLRYNINPPTGTPPGMDQDFGDLLHGSYFDTFTPSQARPLGQVDKTFVIAAIQISIRVWDLKTEQTRQVTIIQDM
jgi:prepilin-type N-terminal cleavage/methylation domain-containing protein